MTKHYMADLGARLIDAGFSILPIMPGTKTPGKYSRMDGQWKPFSGWTALCSRRTKGFEIDMWSGMPPHGIGIACGKIVGIDIDIVQDAEVSKQIEGLAREMLGDTPCVRIGLYPKRLLVYRTDAPFSGFKRHPIEVLARGQQFVAFAEHPETCAPYYWPGESLADIRFDELPAVTEEQCRTFADRAFALVPDALRPSRLSNDDGGEHSSAAHQNGTFEAIEDALKWLPNPDLNYDDWIRVGMAIKGAIGGAGELLFYEWSARAAKNDPATTEKSWRGFKPRSIGAGTVYYLAEQHGWHCPPHMAMNGGVVTWEPGHHPAQAWLDKIAAGMAPPPEDRTPPEVGGVGGILGDFIAYTLASARMPQPILALGAAIATVGVVAGRRYRGPTNLRPNVYVLGLAESGGGKDHARTCVEEALQAAGLGELIGGSKIASGAGLMTALTRSPASIFQLDEFGQFIMHAVGPRAPKHLADIWNYLTELYTSSKSTFRGVEYGNQKERPREIINQPCCVVHATTVPGPFWKALQSGSMLDGSLARWLVFQTDNPFPDPVHKPADSSEVPERLAAGLRGIAAGAEGWNGDALSFGPCGDPKPYMVPYTPEAEQWAEGYSESVVKRQRDAAGTSASATLARLFEHVSKLALIRAVSDNPVQPVIDIECMEWAHSVVEFSVNSTLRDAERHVADNETEAANKRILEIIRKAGPDGMRHSALVGKTKALKLRDRAEIIQSLREEEAISATQVQTGGRPLLIYRAIS